MRSTLRLVAWVLSAIATIYAAYLGFEHEYAHAAYEMAWAVMCRLIAEQADKAGAA